MLRWVNSAAECALVIIDVVAQACVETATRTVGGAKNFPLRIEPAPDGLKQVESECQPELVARLLGKLDWAALRKTAAELGIAELPESKPSDPASDEGFLKSVHDLIMDIHIVEGAMVCPNCGRRYPIKNGIPNMLLLEDEV